MWYTLNTNRKYIACHVCNHRPDYFFKFFIICGFMCVYFYMWVCQWYVLKIYSCNLCVFHSLWWLTFEEQKFLVIILSSFSVFIFMFSVFCFLFQTSLFPLKGFIVSSLTFRPAILEMTFKHYATALLCTAWKKLSNFFCVWELFSALYGAKEKHFHCSHSWAWSTTRLLIWPIQCF